MTTPNIHVIRAAPAVLAAPGPVGADRLEIAPVARLRFDELRGRVAKIGSTMLGVTATQAAVDQAEAALAEIEQLAKAARAALRGRKG